MVGLCMLFVVCSETGLKCRRDLFVFFSLSLHSGVGGLENFHFDDKRRIERVLKGPSHN